VYIGSAASNVTLSHSTIAGNGHSVSTVADVGVFNGHRRPGVVGDHLLMFNQNNNWEYDGVVSDSYIIVAPGFACTGAHYEPVYNTGSFEAVHSVLLNPAEQTAVGFNDDVWCGCATRMSITHSLVGGGGYSFYAGHPSTSGGEFVFRNNRVARCTGPTTYNSATGGTYCNPAPLTISGTLTSGSATVTGIANVAVLWPGETITGAGIPAGTTIVSISQSDGNGVGSPRITLSANATVSGVQALTVTQNGTPNAGGDRPGFDLHGFFPRSGYFGLSTWSAGCVQSGNVWDDNNAATAVC
jgi:hypothetical protein